MEADDIFCILVGDELIVAVGYHYFEHADCEPGGDTTYYVSQKMRELATFLNAVRDYLKNDHRSLILCMRAKEVKKVTSAVKVL